MLFQLAGGPPASVHVHCTNRLGYAHLPPFQQGGWFNPIQSQRREVFVHALWVGVLLWRRRTSALWVGVLLWRRRTSALWVGVLLWRCLLSESLHTMG